MIIFDLDGTLADCNHRKHLVMRPRGSKFIYDELIPIENGDFLTGNYYEKEGKKFVPRWQEFFEACHLDTVISPTRCLFDFIGMKGQSHSLQIWSGRCESVMEKTKEWLRKYSFAYAFHEFQIPLKMRPLGDYTPDDQLKERWLDEAISQGNKIDFVFDDRPKVVRMWKRRGIFVFNCYQRDEEF